MKKNTYIYYFKYVTPERKDHFLFRTVNMISPYKNVLKCSDFFQINIQ